MPAWLPLAGWLTGANLAPINHFSEGRCGAGGKRLNSGEEGRLATVRTVTAAVFVADFDFMELANQS